MPLPPAKSSGVPKHPPRTSSLNKELPNLPVILEASTPRKTTSRSPVKMSPHRKRTEDNVRFICLEDIQPINKNSNIGQSHASWSPETRKQSISRLKSRMSEDGAPRIVYTEEQVGALKNSWAQDALREQNLASSRKEEKKERPNLRSLVRNLTTSGRKSPEGKRSSAEAQIKGGAASRERIPVVMELRYKNTEQQATGPYKAPAFGVSFGSTPTEGSSLIGPLSKTSSEKESMRTHDGTNTSGSFSSGEPKPVTEPDEPNQDGDITMTLSSAKPSVHQEQIEVDRDGTTATTSVTSGKPWDMDMPVEVKQNGTYGTTSFDAGEPGILPSSVYVVPLLKGKDVLIPQLPPPSKDPAVDDPTTMTDFDRLKSAVIHHMNVGLARISQQLNDRLEQEIEAMRTHREQQEINLIIAVEALKSRQRTDLTEIKRMMENLTNRVKRLQDTVQGGAHRRVRPMEYREVDSMSPDEFF